MAIYFASGRKRQRRVGSISLASTRVINLVYRSLKYSNYAQHFPPDVGVVKAVQVQV